MRKWRSTACSRKATNQGFMMIIAAPRWARCPQASTSDPDNFLRNDIQSSLASKARSCKWTLKYAGRQINFADELPCKPGLRKGAGYKQPPSLLHCCRLMPCRICGQQRSSMLASMRRISFGWFCKACPMTCATPGIRSWLFTLKSICRAALDIGTPGNTGLNACLYYGVFQVICHHKTPPFCRICKAFIRLHEVLKRLLGATPVRM